MDAVGLKQALAESRERLLRSISGVTEEQFKRRPAAAAADPAPWCIAEVLAHLLDEEKRWAEHVRLALAEDGASVAATDATAQREAARAGRLAPVPQLIHGLLAARRELERRVDAAAAAGALERAVVHATRGRLTIAAIVRDEIAGHEAEHVSQIERLKAAQQEQ